MGKNLLYTACTCKMSTTLKAHISALFLSELKTKLGLGGPLELSDFKNGQKFCVYRMYQHNEHNFESLYLCHFLLELKIT